MGVDADHLQFAFLDLVLRVFHRPMENLAEKPAGGQLFRIAHGFDRVNSRANSHFKLIGQRLEEVRAAKRIQNFGCASFKIENLLGAEPNNVGIPAWRAVRLVKSRNFQRLHTGKHER